MTTLKEIMSPKSIAIVGASDDKTRIGGRPLSNMIENDSDLTSELIYFSLMTANEYRYY